MSPNIDTGIGGEPGEVWGAATHDGVWDESCRRRHLTVLEHPGKPPPLAPCCMLRPQPTCCEACRGGRSSTLALALSICTQTMSACEARSTARPAYCFRHSRCSGKPRCAVGLLREAGARGGGGASPTRLVARVSKGGTPLLGDQADRLSSQVKYALRSDPLGVPPPQAPTNQIYGVYKVQDRGKSRLSLSK